MKQKKSAKEKTIERQIWNLDTAALLKMDTIDFCVLRDRADAEGRRKLDYLLNRASLETTIRRIVQEELAKTATKRIKRETKK
jgi:hypothetical protein